jgi:hypothetical protein
MVEGRGFMARIKGNNTASTLGLNPMNIPAETPVIMDRATAGTNRLIELAKPVNSWGMDRPNAGIIFLQPGNKTALGIRKTSVTKA